MTPRLPGGARASLVGAGLVLTVLGAACRQVASTVLDIPPGRPAPAPVVARPSAPTVAAVDEGPPPAFERTLNPDSARALLPRDHAGNIDWVQAFRTGVIRPRAALPGSSAPPNGFQFGFDFMYKGPDSTFDALFPHSVHTEWLACQQCHPRIFAYRNTPVTMGDIFQGRFCAECHGKVSYPVMTGCERCHVRLAMPAGRATPDFIGTLTFRRAPAAAGNAAGMQTDSLPASIFPHWVHRSRFRCKVCHMDLFEPRAGANTITMKAIGEGAACGRCHDGTTAFRATIGTCQRCHVAPTPTGSH